MRMPNSGSDLTCSTSSSVSTSSPTRLEADESESGTRGVGASAPWKRPRRFFFCASSSPAQRRLPSPKADTCSSSDSTTYDQLKRACSGDHWPGLGMASRVAAMSILSPKTMSRSMPNSGIASTSAAEPTAATK